MLISEIDTPSLRRIDLTNLKNKFTDDLNRLINIITHYDFKIRIVGGAVRDLLLGIAPRDIDLLTDALPDEIIFILEKYNLNYISKGMKHGTIKVKFDKEDYEITSVAFSITDTCCPDNIEIDAGGSWKEDAKRRDFTVDAMSLSLDGHLYDYVKGYEDIRKQFVRFIKEPEEQITKDPIVLLRFFKLLSMFQDPKFDKSVLSIIKKNANLINKIKPHRIDKEIENIKVHQSGEKVLKMMINLGLGKFIPKLKKEL